VQKRESTPLARKPVVTGHARAAAWAFVKTQWRTLRQTLERIESCVALQARQSPALTTWLAEAQ
jgi:hypothetical protein